MRFVPERILRCRLVSDRQTFVYAFRGAKPACDPIRTIGAFKKMVDTNQKQETDFAAFVGIDWADQKHAWALQSPTHPDVESGHLDHTPEAVEACAAELARRFGGRPIAVALKRSRGSLLFMFSKYAH